MYPKHQFLRVRLEDSGWPGRGFFSSVNLVLHAIQWCQNKGLQPFIGNTILRLYSHPMYGLIGTRPISNFFGEAYYTSEDLKEIHIGDIWNDVIRNINIDSDEVLDRLRAINRILVGNIPRKTLKHINKVPEDWPSRYDVTIHYRGCDYLKNTPVDHTPNILPEAFAKRIYSHVANKEHIFVATDDDTFLNCLKDLKVNFYSFNNACRRGPGKGSHIKSGLQRIGLESLNAPINRGMNVLRDCIHLSRSNNYIGSNSNLMYYARILNREISTHNITVSH